MNAISSIAGNPLTDIKSFSNRSNDKTLAQGNDLLRRAQFDRPEIVRAPSEGQIADATKVRDAFSEFFGKTFYSQMLKSMRSTQGEVPYFNGGQAEKMFQSQLDEALVDDMSQATESSFSASMFEQQFPQHAKVLEQAEAAKQFSGNKSATPSNSLSMRDLNELRRR